MSKIVQLKMNGEGITGGFDFVTLLVGVGGFGAGVVVLYAIIRYRSGQAEE